MLGRRLPEWDLDTSGTSLRRWISGAQYAAQKIRQRLQLLKGEWYLDRNKGFPLRQEILVKKPREDLVKALYRRTILEVPGIVDVTRLDLSFDYRTRTVSGSFAARYVDGTVIPGTI